jgi:hypothetical protein
MKLTEMGYRIEHALPEWFTPLRALYFIIFALWALLIGL